VRACFGILLFCLCFAGLRLWQQGAVLHSDLLALLPQGENGAATTAASRQLNAALQNDFIFLLSAEQPADLRHAATAVLAQLEAVQHMIMLDPEEEVESYLDYVQQLKSYRFSLLSPAQETQIRATTGDELLAQALLALYSPSAMGRVASVPEDPLGLFDAYVVSVTKPTVDIYQSGELTYLAVAGRDHVLFHGRVLPGAFSLDAQSEVLGVESTLAAMLAGNHPGVELLRGGVVFHAARAARVARHEVGLIALGSGVGIILLFILAFRSLRPLLLSLASVLFGCGSALLVCWNLFPHLHLVTLVFGASLIGVAVDYSLHFLTHSGSSVTMAGADSSSVKTPPLKFLLPGLLLALATSLVGFGSLLQASLPGLRQMAVFSMVGLVSAWLFVVVMFPVLAPGQSRIAVRPVRFMAALPDLLHRRTPGRRLIALACVVLTAYGLSQLQSSSDIRLFHMPDADLLAQQQRIQSLLPAQAPNQFYLVKAPSEETLLQRLELVQPVLEQLRGQHAIGSYQLLSDALPSLQRQQFIQSLLQDTVYRPGGEAEQVLSTLGFDVAAVSAFQESVHSAQTLSPEKWRSMAPPQLAQGLLGIYQGRHYALVTLGSVEDMDALQGAAATWEWLQFVDTVGQLSNSLDQQRHKASGLLVLAYILIGLVLLLRYRRLAALRLLLVPLLASGLALAAMGIAGHAITLFHVFALFLVLGLGMDYSIFNYESGTDRAPCLLAIFLSFATSGLSFGLLALSNTPMIAAFGLTVLLGSVGNWLLLPLSVKR
jgi:predicted exporter